MGEERTYIGCKIIKAVEEQEMIQNPESDSNRPGYRVTYPDGYVSWSPKAVFEGAYRLVSLEEEVLILGDAKVSEFEDCDTPNCEADKA